MLYDVSFTLVRIMHVHVTVIIVAAELMVSDVEYLPLPLGGHTPRDMAYYFRVSLDVGVVVLTPHPTLSSFAQRLPHASMP